MFKKALAECTSESKAVIDRLLVKIVDETIGKKSEAVLLAVIEMGEFCLNELKDEFLIGYVWERSFLSQWFSDQEAARKLFDKHERLRLEIAKRVNNLCFSCMQEFNTEPLYRLTELFLKHNMSTQCRPILISLFEYEYWRRNLRACSEIMQNSIDLDIPLPEACNQKLLDLLLGRPGSLAKPAAESAAKRKQKLQAKKYELKF
ncbi:AAEL014641-PA [Aedes aegypti]|nr:AAEL014641-PA [Aedes aegypti]